ncbi:putative laccase [Helianthus debilis subsp. tardiflorus]
MEMLFTSSTLSELYQLSFSFSPSHTHSCTYVMPALLVVGLVLAFFSLSASAATVETSFHVKNLTVNRLCQNQVIMAVNGSLPGPTLRVKEGGFNLTGQVGTLWWHAHSQWLRATVHGALIIRPREGQKYPFIKPYREDTIMLGEWWNADPNDVESAALATGAVPNIADAYTINGWPGDMSNSTCRSNITYRLDVVPGRTYLLRIINAALNTQFFFKIANHNFTVVAVDAAYTNPFPTDVVVVKPPTSC